MIQIILIAIVVPALIAIVIYEARNKKKARKKQQTNAPDYLSKKESAQQMEEEKLRYEAVKKLFETCLISYNKEYCQCSYPRFHQIASIDCAKNGYNFKCYDTDLLIDMAKPYFNIKTSDLTDECKNEKWVCKKCGSHYEYGWQDFSIYIERQKLVAIKLVAPTIGKLPQKPIPVHIGLTGHSIPSSNEIVRVDFQTFEHYITEK